MKLDGTAPETFYRKNDFNQTTLMTTHQKYYIVLFFKRKTTN